MELLVLLFSYPYWFDCCLVLISWEFVLILVGDDWIVGTSVEREIHSVRIASQHAVSDLSDMMRRPYWLSRIPQLGFESISNDVVGVLSACCELFLELLVWESVWRWWWPHLELLIQHKLTRPIPWSQQAGLWASTIGIVGLAFNLRVTTLYPKNYEQLTMEGLRWMASADQPKSTKWAFNFPEEVFTRGNAL